MLYHVNAFRRAVYKLPHDTEVNNLSKFLLSSRPSTAIIYSISLALYSVLNSTEVVTKFRIIEQTIEWSKKDIP